MNEFKIGDEVFRDVPGYSDKYSIGNKGTLLSHVIAKNRVMKPSKNTDGYLVVGLATPGAKNGKKNFQIHRLVMMAFVLESSEWPEGMVTDHLNGIKDDNRLENLEIITNQENLIRASLAGSIVRRTPVKCRDWKTKEVFVFKNCGECSELTGVHRENIVNQRIKQPWKVWPEGYQYCRPDEEFPDEVEFVIVNRPTLCKSLKDGKVLKFDTSTELSEYLGYSPSHISTLLSNHTQPMTSNFHLIKFEDTEEDWRLIIDPIKELIETSECAEAMFVWDGENKPMLFLNTADCGRFFKIGKTTVLFRTSQYPIKKEKIKGYYWIKYKDWVVYKPFELRERFDKYLVPTSGGDTQEGDSNQVDMVKSRIIEIIRSQDAKYDELNNEEKRYLIDRAIRRRLSVLHNKMNKSRLPEYWLDREAFIKDVVNIQGYFEKDLFSGRLFLKLNVKKNPDNTYSEYHSRENSVFCLRNEYRV